MIIRKTFEEGRNPRYLKFFSSICTLKSKGIVQNQEILYKIIQMENNKRALLVNINKFFNIYAIQCLKVYLY